MADGRTWRLFVLTTLCGVLLTALARPAFAQVDEVPTGPGWRVGTLTLTPTVIVTSGYDSNVNREAPPISARESYALPQLELTWRTRRWLGVASTTHELTRLSGEEKGGINWRGFGSLTFTGPRYKPYIQYDRPRTNARPTGFEVGKRSVHLDDNLTAGVDVKATPRTTFSLKGQFDKTRWDADAAYAGSSLRDTLNRDSHSVSGSMAYRLTPLTSLTGSGEVSQFRFIYSPARDATSQMANAGVEFKSPAMIDGSASVGVLRFRQVQRAVTDFTGVVASSSLGYARPSGAYTRFEVSRNLTFSYDPSRSYFVLLGLNLSFSRPIGTKWRTVAYVGHHNIDYPATIAGVRPRGNRLEDAGFAAAYQLGPWTRIGAAVDNFVQRGQVGYSGFRVVGFLHIGIGTPRRLDRPIPLTQ
ncbi:MAG: outer membrane beta-barrel protein [Vicinamibacterales bacterium]